MGRQDIMSAHPETRQTTTKWRIKISMEDTEMNVREISISDIQTGDRIRKDIGNIEELAADIKEHGLINPITVMEQEKGGYLLLTGFRRLQAYQQLGLSVISASVLSSMDATERLLIEISENEKRQNFTPSERTEYGIRLKIVEQEKANMRMSAHARDGYNKKTEIQGCDERRYPDGESNKKKSKGRVNDIVAKAVGFGSGRQFERAEYVAKHNPKLMSEVDKGNISLNKAYEQTKQERRDEKSAERKPSEQKKIISVEKSDYAKSEIVDNEEADVFPTISDLKKDNISKEVVITPTATDDTAIAVAEVKPITVEEVKSTANKNQADNDSYQTTGIPANRNAPCYLGMKGAEDWEPIKPIQLFKIKTPKNGGHEALLSNPLYAAVYEKYTEAMQSCNLVLGYWDHLKDGYETRIRGDQTNISTLIKARDKAEGLADSLAKENEALSKELEALRTAVEQANEETEKIRDQLADANSKYRIAEGQAKALRTEVEALKRELYGA